MIEGLRVLPFWHETFATPDHPQRNCEACMKTQTDTWRQLSRCGRLPAVERVGSMPSKGWPVPDTNLTTSVCPTYLISLPEVQDTAEVYPQWKERTLTEYLGEAPTKDTLACLAILGNAHNEHDRHLMLAAERKRNER